jgi:hypothetical protein
LLLYSFVRCVAAWQWESWLLTLRQRQESLAFFILRERLDYE